MYTLAWEMTVEAAANFVTFVYFGINEIIREKADRVEKFLNDQYLPYREGDLFLMKNMAGKYQRFNGTFRDISMRGPQLSYESFSL